MNLKLSFSCSLQSSQIFFHSHLKLLDVCPYPYYSTKSESVFFLLCDSYLIKNNSYFRLVTIAQSYLITYLKKNIQTLIFLSFIGHTIFNGFFFNNVWVTPFFLFPYASELQVTFLFYGSSLLQRQVLVNIKYDLIQWHKLSVFL